MSRVTKTIQVVMILAIAFAVKAFYSTASVNDLRWILAPTTLFVELITGRQFTFESQAGYMSSDHTFLIAASCSGVNFLIISFLVLAIGTIRHEWPGSIEWRSLATAILIAYIATLVANTTRIVIALSTQGVQTTLLDRDELHRAEGIVVYFGFLILLFLASEKLAMRGDPVQESAISLASRSKYLLIVYYAVTLGVPLVRASYHEPGFWQHALFVILIPLILIVPFALVSRIGDGYAARWSARLR